MPAISACEYPSTSNSTTAVRRRSAVGEPYVDLTPGPGAETAGGHLGDGDVIPISFK